MALNCPQCGSKVEKSTIENEATHTRHSCVNCEYGYIEGQ